MSPLCSIRHLPCAVHRASFNIRRLSSPSISTSLSDPTAHARRYLHGILLLGTGNSLHPWDARRGEELEGGLRLSQCIGIVQGADLITVSPTDQLARGDTHTLRILAPSKVAVSLHMVEPQSPLYTLSDKNTIGLGNNTRRS